MVEPRDVDGEQDQETVRPPTAWLVGTGEGGRHFPKFVSHEMVAVDFRRVGDAGGLTRWEMAAQLRTGKDRIPPERLAEALREFVDGMAEGDYVFAGDGQGQVVIGLVTGPYRWLEHPPVPHFTHTRKVAWLGGFALDELPDPVRMPVVHNQGSIHRFADQPAALAWCRLAEEGQGAPPPRIKPVAAARERPPSRRSPSATSSSPSRTRAARPAAPPAPERRFCTVCYSSLPAAHFEGSATVCRSCQAMDS
jgi:hypothetical protein